MAVAETICSVCGARNHVGAARCVSCGAKLEAYAPTKASDDEESDRRHQQDGFEWKWAVIAAVLYVVLQGIVLAALPIFLSEYDPQGLPGLLISAAVWFAGGVFIGVISPGKTFFEPAVGALLSAVPTIAYLMSIADVYQLSMLAYVAGGLLGVMISLLGAVLGEKIQMGRSAL